MVATPMLDGSGAAASNNMAANGSPAAFIARMRAPWLQAAVSPVGPNEDEQTDQNDDGNDDFSKKRN
jgi:hypothetical protein